MNQKLIPSLISMLLVNAATAATRVDLKHQSANYIKPYFAMQLGAGSNPDQLHKVRTDIDFNQVTHVRLQQMYSGVPVWNGTSVIHLPKANNQRGLLANLNTKTTMDGVIYEGLDSDLTSTPTYALSDAQKAKAMQEAKLAFEQKMGVVDLSYEKESVKTIVYIDDNKKAHYSFLVSFYYDDGKTGAHLPTTIMDAESLLVYHTWDGVMTENADEDSYVLAGGVGGNEKTGEVIYDGTDAHFPAVKIRKIDWPEMPEISMPAFTIFTLMNEDITIYDMSYASIAYEFCFDKVCANRNAQHNNMYWLSNDHGGTRWKEDEMNGGYSPSLDAFYSATIVSNFYRDWYGVPALVKEDGQTPMKLIMRVHYGRNFDNAFWDGEQMTFGDGGAMLYPLTSLGVAAHEISHGFTTQHSDLNGYEPQMRALNEAFSDAASVTMQYYATGNISWDFGREIMKNEGAMRYLDNPKKDGRSIDNMKDFDGTEAHAGAGIFNKAFYLIATTKGWDIRKAFNVMVKANMNYWTSSMTTLTEAACGVTSAARDYGYNTADVRVAFVKVGIDTVGCDAPPSI